MTAGRPHSDGTVGTRGRGGVAAAPTAELRTVPYITSNVSKTMTWAPPRRTGQVSAYFAAWSSESAWITE